ncbi:MAG: hypothetical protein IT437_12675 [Phycisphaerales bacterium]|nr:hypothetical protein [Phycisphaerales bacterium]
MSKATKNESAMLAAADNGTAALAVPENIQGGAIIEGGDQGVQISRLALYQGTSTEQAAYPDSNFKRGDFFDTLEGRAVGQKVRIVPIFGWKSWVRFDRGSAAPIYSTRNKAEVPPEDLEWHDKSPPLATECVNVVCAVEGEAWPYLLVFKRTGLKAWNKNVGPMEARRGSTSQGPGLYELSSVEDKNPEGQAYKRITARFVGNPTPELVSLAAGVKRKLDEFRRLAEKHADNATGEPQAEPDAPY